LLFGKFFGRKMALEKDTIIAVAKQKVPELEALEHRNQLTLKIPVDKLKDLCLELKQNEATSFDMLIDITAIDWNRSKERFETVYMLYSNKYKSRIRLKCALEGDFPVCPSITSIWESANWYERETYDMYGIKFEGHPNLRRFYMPEDFKDPETGDPLYPLRKEFPLMGIPYSLPMPPFPEKFGKTIE